MIELRLLVDYQHDFALHRRLFDEFVSAGAIILSL